MAGLAPPVRAENPKPSSDYLLHLPGISGYHWVDKQLLAGLREGGFNGTIEVHDWTGDDPGLGSLFARQRNEREAQVVANLIEKHYRDHPKDRIVLTAHSGGTGIMVWALENLPKDVKVDTVLLLAPALSPRYDLTDALTHVRGGMYAFTSELDAFVLGAGTSTFGTIDGVKCDAAGRWGFEMPEGADPDQYKKLVPMPYDGKKWLPEGNMGDHIGTLNRRFARNVLAPLVAGGQDVRAGAATTRPSEAHARDTSLNPHAARSGTKTQ